MMMSQIKKILLIVAGVIVIFVAGIVVLFSITVSHEHATKLLLSQEITKLPIPASCHETSRQYQSGGVDTDSTWSVNYACNISGGAAYNDITNGLTNMGFVLDSNRANSNTAGFATQFTYHNNTYDVFFKFMPLADETAVSPSTLQNTNVDEIQLGISRYVAP